MAASGDERNKPKFPFNQRSCQGTFPDLKETAPSAQGCSLGPEEERSCR